MTDNDTFAQFQLENELRLRLRPFVAREPEADDQTVALAFLDSLSDDEYHALIERYVASLVPLVDHESVQKLRRKKRLT